MKKNLNKKFKNTDNSPSLLQGNKFDKYHNKELIQIRKWIK